MLPMSKIVYKLNLKESEMNINEIHKLGWIKIDTSTPINDQVSVGDYVISSLMFIFSSEEFDSIYFEKIKDRFLVYKVDEVSFNYNSDASYYNLTREAGIFFVLKSEIKYITMKVPTFQVDRVKQLGGIEI